MKLKNTTRTLFKNRTSILAILLLFCLATITACADDSSNPDALTGVFLDSPVGGLNYQTATMSGITDENGTFMYHEGEIVTFLIGDVMLGSAPGNNIMTPVDLVPEAIDELMPSLLTDKKIRRADEA